MSWATVEQYEARYGAAVDVDTLQECLDDATAQINSQLTAAGIDYSEPSADYARLLMMVCRQMAHRAMGATESALPFGATQASQTAGPYTQSFSFGNPYGDLYITASEKRMLGIGKPYIGSVPTAVAPRRVWRFGDVCDD